MLPRETKARMMIEVRMVAFTGSLASPEPAFSALFQSGTGSMRSPARACSVLGATKMEPMAEDAVAVANPMGIIGMGKRRLLFVSLYTQRQGTEV